MARTGDNPIKEIYSKKTLDRKVLEGSLFQKYVYVPMRT